MRKAGTQEKVLAQVVTSHITHMCTGRHKEESRNRPTASPSYHGRRGATRRKTPTASPGTAGQPHQVTQCHHIGPTPPHTGNRLDSHQCQRGSGNQSHRGHGAHPAHHCNRHWSPPPAKPNLFTQSLLSTIGFCVKGVKPAHKVVQPAPLTEFRRVSPFPIIGWTQF